MNLRELLEGYREETIPKEDIEKIERLLCEADSSSNLYEIIYSEFSDTIEDPSLQTPSVDHLFGVISKEIARRELAKKSNNIRSMGIWWRSIAIILIAPLITTATLLVVNRQKYNAIINNPTPYTITAPNGSVVEFQLPDGTKGWLNSRSTLEYAVPFENRDIAVTGEVYLEVAHNPNSPFTIDGEIIDIEVLGTKFNYTSYLDEEFYEIVLIEGSVRCSSTISGLNRVLQPKDQLRYSGDSITFCQNIDIAKYVEWKNRKLIFKGDDMHSVIRRLEHWYGTDIEVQDEELWDYSFRGIFKDNTLEEILSFLGKASPLEYKVEDDRKDSDGTISNKRVILSLPK